MSREPVVKITECTKKEVSEWVKHYEAKGYMTTGEKALDCGMWVQEMKLKDGARLISDERDRQKTLDHTQNDQAYKDGQLIDAACAFALQCNGDFNTSLSLIPWNFLKHHLKVENKPKVEQLAIAGALIAAEIDRIQNEL